MTDNAAMTDTRGEPGPIDGGRVAEAVSSLTNAVLGESTPLGPALAAPIREARCEFAIKVIVTRRRRPRVFAVAAGWAVASLDEDAASRLGAGFGSAAAGVDKRRSPSPGMRTTVPLPGAMVPTRRRGCRTDGRRCGGDPRVKPRLELCLLAFHRMGRRARMAALADALETVAGSIPGGGATSRVAHAAFLARTASETSRDAAVARGASAANHGEDEKKPNANAARGSTRSSRSRVRFAAAAAVHENSGTSRRGEGGEGGSSSAPRRSRRPRGCLVLAEAPVEPEGLLDRSTVRPGPGRRVGGQTGRVELSSRFKTRGSTRERRA